MTTRYLIDKSAFARQRKPGVRAVVEPLAEKGLLAICGAIELEILYSARSVADMHFIIEQLDNYEWLSTPDEVWDRAIEIQRLLIAARTWKAVSLPDIVIAATAERHGYTVLHYDGDYDLIAAVTGQPTQWVVPASTAD